MSPKPFHPKIETNNGLYDPPSSPPSPLKINKDSFAIKKPSIPSSSSSTCLSQNTSVLKPQQHKQPVIIYTHSPRIIHTHPRDFMALVQKLTGYNQFDEDPSPRVNANNNESPCENEESGNNKGVNSNEDDESMNSVVTDETGSCLSDPPVNSYFIPPPMFDHHHHSTPCFNNISVFAPTTADFLCSTTSTTTSPSSYGYPDPFYFMPSSTRRPMSSPSLESLKDYQEDM